MDSKQNIKLEQIYIKEDYLNPFEDEDPNNATDECIEDLQSEAFFDGSVNVAVKEEITTDDNVSIKTVPLEIGIKEEDLSKFIVGDFNEKNCPVEIIKDENSIRTGKKPFKCNICAFTTAMRRNFNQHMKIHSGAKPFQCNSCDYKTVRKEHLKRHVKTHHVPFECNICGNKLPNKSYLTVHLQTHGDCKPFQCTSCDYKTERKVDFARHCTMHSGNGTNVFKCKTCGYEAGCKSSLLIHFQTHNGKNPFKCKLCGYMTTSQGYLKKHLVVHNSKKPFACTLCKYTTARKYMLKAHLLVHEGKGTRAKKQRCGKYRNSNLREQKVTPQSELTTSIRARLGNILIKGAWKKHTDSKK